MKYLKKSTKYVFLCFFSMVPIFSSLSMLSKGGLLFHWMGSCQD